MDCVYFNKFVAKKWDSGFLATIIATKLWKRLWGVKIWTSMRGIWGVFWVGCEDIHWLLSVNFCWNPSYYWRIKYLCYSLLATKISEKKGERFDQMMTFIRTKLRFSLLTNTLITIRGYRGKTNKEPNMPSIQYNLIPHQSSYES